MPSPSSIDASVPASYDTATATTNCPVSSLVCTKFIDHANAGLNYLRVTSHIPTTNSLSSDTHIPLTVVATPLADVAFVFLFYFYFLLLLG